MNRSEDHFLTVLKANQGIIRRIANAYCAHVEDRNDLIQEITIQLWKSWESYDEAFKLSTWIYRIGLNVAISFYRKTYRKQALHQAFGQEQTLVDDHHEDDTADNIQKLYRIINQLDELNKAIILMYLNRQSHEEIAETLGISKTNVSTKISRIKQHLKKAFNLK